MYKPSLQLEIPNSMVNIYREITAQEDPEMTAPPVVKEDPPHFHQ